MYAQGKQNLVKIDQGVSMGPATTSPAAVAYVLLLLSSLSLSSFGCYFTAAPTVPAPKDQVRPSRLQGPNCSSGFVHQLSCFARRRQWRERGQAQAILLGCIGGGGEDGGCRARSSLNSLRGCGGGVCVVSARRVAPRAQAS